MRRFLLIILAALPLASLNACDDVTGGNEVILSTDSTLVLRAPTAADEGPSALDASVPQAVSPEFPQVSGAGWDFALRQSGSAFRFEVRDLGTAASRAGISLSNQPFESIDEASRARSTYSDSSIVLMEGASYTFRTRDVRGGCFYYGKLRVVDLDAAIGTARMIVTVNNVRCDDERLTED